MMDDPKYAGMQPTWEHVQAVCRMGQGHACCRFLVFGTKGEGFECAKLSELRESLDHRAVAGEMVARGDNCDGYELKSRQEPVRAN